MGSMTSERVMNLRDAVVPISVIVSIVGGALLIQSRLLHVEFAVSSLKETIQDRDDLQLRRLQIFADALKQMNPNLQVPQIK
jgi:hypothetical protein